MKRIVRLSLIILLIVGCIPTDTLALRPAAFRIMGGDRTGIGKQVSRADASSVAAFLLEKSPFVYRDAAGKIVLRLSSDFDETVTPPYRQQELRIPELIAALFLTDDIRKIRFLIKIKEAVRTALPYRLRRRFRQFLGIPPGLLTLDECKKMSESSGLNENYAGILEAIKEMTGVDKIEVNIVSGGIGQVSRMYFERPYIKRRFKELSTKVVRFFTNSFNFDEEGVFTGKVEGPRGRLVTNKREFVNKGALVLGDKRERKHKFKYLIDVNKGKEAAIKVIRKWIDDIKVPEEHPEKSATVIEKDAVRRWQQKLNDQIARAREGKKQVYPFPFAVLHEVSQVLNYLPELDGHFFTTGIGRNTVKGDPEWGRAQFKLNGTAQVLVEARFLRIKSKRFAKYLGNGFFKSEGAVVPFIGGFYRPDGSEVSDEELAKIGREWLRDEKGELIKFPVFATQLLPSRIFTIPIGGKDIKVVFDDGKIHILATIEDYEEFISRKFSKEKLAEIRKKAVKATRRAPFAEKLSPSSDFYKELRERNYHQVMREFLTSKDQPLFFNALAVQYKGSGAKYVCQPKIRSRGAKRVLSPYQRLWSELAEEMFEETEIYAVVDSRYEDKSGIILSDYQGNDVAIGSSSVKEIEATKIDRNLVSSGAVLSTINIDNVEIANETQLKAIGAAPNLKPLIGSVRLVIDDTRNLDDILYHGDYKEFLKGEISHDEAFAKNYHLTNFCSNLANNIAACLKCRLTVNPDDLAAVTSIGFTRNVSPFGLLRDTGDLATIEIPQEAMFIIKSALDGMLVLAKKAGMTVKEFVDSQYFDNFFKILIQKIGTDAQAQETCLSQMDALKEHILKAKVETDEEIYRMLIPIIRLVFNHWCNALDIKDAENYERLFRQALEGYSDLSILTSTQTAPPDLNTDNKHRLLIDQAA